MSATQERPPVHLTLEPRPEAAHAVREELSEEGLAEDLRATVALLVTEVVANSVRHAGLTATDRIEVLAWLEPEHARVEVLDRGLGFDPEIRHRAPGYGLRIIDAMASDWGAEPQDGGWRVWFEVDRDHVARVESGAASRVAA